MAVFATLGTVVDLANNYFFCCGTEWDGSLTVMSYKGINQTAPR
jgi:hypothetical protein